MKNCKNTITDNMEQSSTNNTNTNNNNTGAYHQQQTQNNHAEYLVCAEQLTGRISPDLWPEAVPGFNQFSRSNQTVRTSPFVNGITLNQKSKFRADLDADDVRLVNDLGQLSADQLMTHIRKLQNSSYLLGLKEAKLSSRGKLLRVFDK